MTKLAWDETTSDRLIITIELFGGSNSNPAVEVQECLSISELPCFLKQAKESSLAGCSRIFIVCCSRILIVCVGAMAFVQFISEGLAYDSLLH
jgi:hypothetical protein